MGNFVFQGASSLTLDGKGRLAVPARHRDVLAATANGQVTLTKHPDGCLMLFPRPAWEAFREKIANLPMSANGWRRVFLGNAQDADVDASGRVLISPELRTWAGLDKSVMLIGLGSFFEVWDTQRHAAHEQATLETPMPAALQDFSFGL